MVLFQMFFEFIDSAMFKTLQCNYQNTESRLFFFRKMTKIITFQRAGSTLHVMDQVEVYLKIYIMLLIAGRFELFLDIYRTQIFLTIFLFIIFSMKRRGNLSSYISSRRKITLTYHIVSQNILPLMRSHADCELKNTYMFSSLYQLHQN